MKNEKHPFAPIVNYDSKILILGSFPSLISVEKSFYYANKRNQFWKIMNEMFQQNASSIEERTQLVLEKKIALWDSVKHCERKNSSDSQLVVVEVNNIAQFLQKYSNIHTIFFNGQKAYQVYKKEYKELNIYTKVLPSTSSANAIMKYKDKKTVYQKNIRERLGDL